MNQSLTQLRKKFSNILLTLCTTCPAFIGLNINKCLPGHILKSKTVVHASFQLKTLTISFFKKKLSAVRTIKVDWLGVVVN